MKIKLLLLVLLPLSSFAQNFDFIKHYKVNYALATKDNAQFVAIRSFVNDSQKYFLLVNPTTLETKIDLANGYHLNSVTWQNIMAIFKNTPYVASLESALIKGNQLQNAGIDQAIPKEKGITLTIDLCPSHKPLDRIIFQSIFDEFNKIEQPAPVAISVSGKWMLKHQDDLNWLKSLVAKRQLDITWINHTYSHEVNSLPLKENFLLAKGVDIDFEVLENEKLMLKNGLIPTVFFRFPGLVSDGNMVSKIENFGLIPVGSDAWLAKGQQPKAGSIVLVHGNGNEEIGVKDFIQLLKTKQADVKNKQWLLFDLRQGLEKEF